MPDSTPPADALPLLAGSPPGGCHRGHLREIAGVFTRLGFTAFGGPTAHTVMMEREVVTRGQWLDRQHFLDLIAAINFIPGPNSTQLAIQLGYIRGGLPGLVVAGVCFIVPAVLIILPLAWLYVRFGTKPDIHRALISVSAAMVAIVATALWRFTRTGIKNRFTATIFVGATLLGFACEPNVVGALSRFSRQPHPGVAAILTPLARLGFEISRALHVIQPEIAILSVAAVAGAIRARPQIGLGALRALPFLAPIPVSATVEPTAAAGFVSMSLFFLKVGGTMFGSGYVLVSYLRNGLVNGYGWLTESQLLDAIAVGQVTPGPLLTTATFIGFVLGSGRFGGGTGGGVLGAILATVAIFFPSFLLVAILGRYLPRVRANPIARGALDGMNAAVVALILVVTVRLAGAALLDGMSIAIAAVSLMAILIWDVNSTWLILGAAIVGIARQSGGF